MSHHAEASRSVAFEYRLGQCDEELQAPLKKNVTTKPAVFGHISRQTPGSTEATDEYRKRLLGLGVDADKLEAWVADCTELHNVACADSQEIAERTATLTGFQQSANILELEDSGFQSRERDDAARASLFALAHLPAEWKGKRYRRIAGLPTAHAREEGERAERLKQGRQVAGILVEADVPFASSLKHRAPEDITVLRCCRGLRSSTLSQRLNHWRPFRHYLLHTGQGPWPQCSQVVLDYFDLKVEEGLSPSTLPAFLASLHFLRKPASSPRRSSSLTTPRSRTR